MSYGSYTKVVSFEIFGAFYHFLFYVMKLKWWISLQFIIIIIIFNIYDFNTSFRIQYRRQRPKNGALLDRLSTKIARKVHEKENNTKGRALHKFVLLRKEKNNNKIMWNFKNNQIRKTFTHRSFFFVLPIICQQPALHHKKLNY